MSLRRLRVLVENLPPGSATSRKLRGDPWGALEHLIADVYDAVEGTAYNALKAQGGKPKKPKPHPRPSDPKPTKIGDRGHHSQESVLAFIQSRKPPASRRPAERVPAPEAVRGGVLLGPT